MAIYVIDHQISVTREITQIFKAELPHEVILSFGSVDEFISIAKFIAIPKLFILEIIRFGSQDTKSIKKIKKQYPAIPIIVYTSLTYEKWSLLCKEAGADYFLSKNIGIHTLLKISKNISNTSIDVAVNLTKRQKEIIKLLAKGYSNIMIHEALLISERTVKIHIGRLFKRINVKNRTQAALYALKFNLDK